MPTKAIRKPKSPATPTIKEESENLDLTGSPLKDDFHIEVVNMDIEIKGDHYKIWSDAEESYAGVNVDIARAIVSDMGDLEEGENVPKMWILCNGLDPEATLLMENEMTSEWWTRGVVQLKEAVVIDKVTMDQLISVHTKSYPG